MQILKLAGARSSNGSKSTAAANKIAEFSEVKYFLVYLALK